MEHSKGAKSGLNIPEVWKIAQKGGPGYHARMDEAIDDILEAVALDIKRVTKRFIHCPKFKRILILLQRLRYIARLLKGKALSWMGENRIRFGYFGLMTNFMGAIFIAISVFEDPAAVVPFKTGKQFYYLAATDSSLFSIGISLTIFGFLLQFAEKAIEIYENEDRSTAHSIVQTGIAILVLGFAFYLGYEHGR